MATLLDTLVTKLAFKTDTSGLKKADKGLGDLKATAFKVAAGVGAILGGGLFLNAIAGAADETLKWADANGIAVESIGELEFAVQRQGGSIEGLRSLLSNMNKSIGEVERGTGRAKLAFEDYGISIKKANGQTKTADELFLDLNKKFVGLSKAKQFDLAMKMGIDKGTIRLLQTAPDEVARLTREARKLGVLSRKDAEAAAKFNDGLTNMGQVINSIKFEIAGFVFEPISKFFKKLAEGIAFMKEHKGLSLSIIGILGAVALAFSSMGVAAVLAWAGATLPVTAIILAIAAVGIAIAVVTEDFIAFFNGQSSFIGDMVKEWPLLGDAIFFVRDAMVFMFKTWLKGVKNMLEFPGKMVEGIKNMLEFPGKMVEGIKKIAVAIFDFIMMPIRDVIEIIKKIPGIGKTLATNISQSIDTTFGVAPVGLSPALAGGQPITRTNTLTVGELKVDARGGDSQEIVRNVNSALKTQLQNTVEDFDSSIDR